MVSLGARNFAESKLTLPAEVFKDFQTKVRVDAAKRWESNRRAGGRKTQSSVVKSWNVRSPFKSYLPSCTHSLVDICSAISLRKQDTGQHCRRALVALVY